MKTKKIIKVLAANEYGSAGFIEYSEYSEYSQRYFTYSTTKNVERGEKACKFVKDCLKDSKIPFEIHEVTITSKVIQRFNKFSK